MIGDITFANPKLLYLLFINIPLIGWYIYKQMKPAASLGFPRTEAVMKYGKSWRVTFRHAEMVFRVLVISLIIVILARPQTSDTWEETKSEGIDIMISMDISTSMLARDFKPDRIDAAKEVGIQFISGRPHDRIGLVVFAGETFTQCPLTIDHASLINLFKDVKTGMIEDGTAIGDGLAMSVKRLSESEAKSKVIILLTDGDNNRGVIDPETAASIAAKYGIKVYTIGVGSNGLVPYPMQDAFGRTVIQQVQMPLNEEVLKKIASLTGGKYFRASSKNKLEEIYQTIDKMEKSEIDTEQFKRTDEKYQLFALIAILLLAFEIFLRKVLFRTIP